MFSKSDMRYKLMIVWFLAFIGLWMLFKYTFPINTMMKQLNVIEERIEEKDWEAAIDHTTRFKEIFNKNRYFIQMNNSTEAFLTFEHTIGQLEITVNHKQENAFEYIGALKESLNLVIKPFSAP